MRAALEALPDRDATTELEVLSRALSAGADTARERSEKGRDRGKSDGSKTKTTFHISSSAGQVKCTAGPGRLEIKVDRDFSSIDRARLEQAVASLIDGLG